MHLQATQAWSHPASCMYKLGNSVSTLQVQTAHWSTVLPSSYSPLCSQSGSGSCACCRHWLLSESTSAHGWPLGWGCAWVRRCGRCCASCPCLRVHVCVVVKSVAVTGGGGRGVTRRRMGGDNPGCNGCALGAYLCWRASAPHPAQQCLVEGAYMEDRGQSSSRREGAREGMGERRDGEDESGNVSQG